MNRANMLQQLQATKEWDIIIIGGGATGLGAALDAACRGYTTLLIEQFDFAKGTSSRSTKLVHGGVRYLAQGNIKLVVEALKERGRLLRNAPHVTSVQPFVLPVYSYFQKLYYGIGLMIYELLSNKLSVGKTKLLGKKKTIQLLPSIHPKKLKGGILYYDGQFDDARLAIDIAKLAAKKGAAIINYMQVTELLKKDDKVQGVKVTDTISRKEYMLLAKVVINATGVFANTILKMDDAGSEEIITPSQGIHLVIDKQFFAGNNALMIPKTDDGRVLFAVPWYNKVIVGTTDTPINKISFEPKPLQEEIEFILHHFNRYCTSTITSKDVCSIYAGLRPLVKIGKKEKTSLLSRDHTLLVSTSNLITITGGKWTTYRKMAEDAINNAAFVGKLNKVECTTASLQIGIACNLSNIPQHWHLYGEGAYQIVQLLQENNSWNEKIHSNHPYIKAEIIWMIRNEMAVTVEDILARRIRLLLLDAKAAIAAAVVVAMIMKEELKQSEFWMQDQINSFTELAQQYLIT